MLLSLDTQYNLIYTRFAFYYLEFRGVGVKILSNHKAAYHTLNELD